MEMQANRIFERREQRGCIIQGTDGIIPRQVSEFPFGKRVFGKIG